MSNIDYAPLLPEGVACTPSPSTGGGYLYRPNQLLAEAPGVELVEQQLHVLGGNLVRNEPLGASGLTLLEAEVDVPSLVHHVRTVGHEPPPPVWPNHVFHHTSHMRFFTRLPPQPADPPERRANEGLGEGVTVAVIDSGVWDHPWFDGRVVFRSDDLEEPDENGDGLLDLAGGHGTFVAGIILQHAPGATVLARRIPDRLPGGGRTGLVDDLELAAMIDELPDDVDVVNISLGGWVAGDLAPPATAAAIARLRARNPGCVIVAAAGNVPVERPAWPAAFKGVVGVGALQSPTRPWPESGRGWWVDAWASGVDAHSTFFEWSGPMEHPDGADQTFSAGALWTGTSFAAPRIAGAIAAAASAPGRCRRKASELLDTSPVLGGHSGVVLAAAASAP